MFLRFPSRLTVLVAGFSLAAGTLAVSAQDNPKPRKFKVPPPSARIEVTVLRDVNGKPIENAAVVFHPMEGEKDKGAMELKTNEDGKTVIDVLPMGDTVRLQVIAKGFQTYGEDFKVDKSEIAIEVKLKRPGEQYSIYKNHPATADAGKDGGKPANPPKDGAAPPADSKDKPADPSPAPPPPQ
jgi:hypothetical protein